MKPIILKDLAKRFADTYYPHWLSRFERIWDIFEKMLLTNKTFVNGIPEFELGAGLPFANGAEPRFKDFISGVAIFAFTYQPLRDAHDLTEDTLRTRINKTCLSLKIPVDIEDKIGATLMEMVPELVDRAQSEQDKAAAVKEMEAKETESQQYAVYTAHPSGIGVESETANERTIKRKYLSNKENYDIFVYQHCVEKRLASMIDDQPIDTYETVELDLNVLRLSVLFLKYKNEHLPYAPLYDKAWEGSTNRRDFEKDRAEAMTGLKNAVTALRNTFGDIDGFNIPPARGGGYICKGQFTFCLILKKSLDQWYTLAGV
jgi:hypothetical protein